jgi:SulP family sulfate permease
MFSLLSSGISLGLADTSNESMIECFLEKKSIEKSSDNYYVFAYVQHFDGPIFFGFTSHFKTMMRELPDVKVVIFRMSNVPCIDQSGMYAIEDAILELEKKGINVLLSGIQKQPEDMLRRIALIPNLVEEDHLHSDFAVTVDYLKRNKKIFS